MLELTVDEREYFDEATSEFVTVPSFTLHFEHSLVAISKWESKWHIPFLADREKSSEEIYDYLRCMCLDEGVPSEVFSSLTPAQVKQLNDYIADPMTATTVKEDPNASSSGEIVTSELIYYWMTALQIPVQFENWHINRLLMLIRVCNAKNQPKKKQKMTPSMAADMHALNERRLAAAKAKARRH